MKTNTIKMKESKEYTYFVSYSHKKGFGQIEIIFASPIKTFDHVLIMQNEIQKKNRGKVIILNFILLK